MKGNFKVSSIETNNNNLKQPKLFKNNNTQSSIHDPIYIHQSKLLSSQNPILQHKNKIKKTNQHLQTIKQHDKIYINNANNLLTKKQQPTLKTYNSKNIIHQNQYQSYKLPHVQPLKSPTFLQSRPQSNLQYTKKIINSPTSIKNKPILINQQKITNHQYIHNSQTTSPTNQFLPKLNHLIQSPNNMKTSYLTINQQKKYQPYCKNNSFKRQIPISMMNSKISNDPSSFPIIKKYLQKEQIAQNQNSNTKLLKNQKMKYSMMSPSNSNKSLLNPQSLYDSPQSNKLQYFTQPNDSKLLKSKTNKHNYASTKVINKNMESSMYDQLSYRKNSQSLKSQQQNSKSLKPLSNSKSSQISNKRIIEKQPISLVNQGKEKIYKITNIQSPKSAKQIITNKNYPFEKKISKPQIKTQIKKINSKIQNLKIKQKGIQLIKKQPKLDPSKKKQALLNLKKQHQQFTNQALLHELQCKQQLIINDKEPATKIKHLFSPKMDDGTNLKISLSIIQQKPYRNQVIKQKIKKFQIIQKSDQQLKNKLTKKQPSNEIFNKKNEKITTGIATPNKTRRMSEPLIQQTQKQLIVDQNRKKQATPTRNKAVLDETMETQEIYRTEGLKISDFIRGPQLGRGKFGVVNLARKTGFLFALKTLKKSAIIEERIMEQVIRQIKIQYFLNHKNLVKLYGFFYDKDNLYLLMEYCPDGQLYRILQKKKKFSQQDTCQIMRQLCQGIFQMHKNNIIHRDVKPENVVVSFGMCKICDFGWSIRSKDEFRNTLCGTPLYFSPQLLLEGSYNQKVDIWALGMMAFEMITGSIPFTINTTHELMKIANAQIHYPITMSPITRDFIGMFLQRNPEMRISIQNVLKHNFFQQFHSIQTTKLNKFVSFF